MTKYIHGFLMWKTRLLANRRTRVLSMFETARRKLETLHEQLETEKNTLLKASAAEEQHLQAKIAQVQARLAQHRSAQATLVSEQKAITHTSDKIAEILGDQK